MTVRYERPVSRAAYRGRNIAILAFLMAAIGWGMHRFGPLDTPFFLAIMAAAAALAAIAIYLAVIGLAMLWNRGAQGGRASARAIALSILPIAPAIIGALLYITRPVLYDVSSDLIDPPQWIAEIKVPQLWLGERAPVGPLDRERQMLAYRDLTGRRYEGALDRVYAAARKVAEEAGMEITLERGAPEFVTQPEVPAGNGTRTAEEAVPDSLDNVPVPMPRPEDATPEADGLPPGDAYIQGVHRTHIFGFRQDIVIRLREEAETTLVDIRVSSRYGSHDLGSGADFIGGYLRALDAELLGIAGD